MQTKLDTKQFGPWTVITGASSGIGREFAMQLAARGFHLVLVARRIKLLEEVGAELAKAHGTRFRAVEADLSEQGAIRKITESTDDLEVGLLISNAGTGRVGKFLSFSESDHKSIIQLNAISHMSLTHHFGARMAQRKRGGIILTGAMGAVDGVPYMSNEAGTKGYIQSLGKSLHSEFKALSLHMTVLVASPTETPIFGKLGFTRANSPMAPITAKQCVQETLEAFSKNKATVLPGRKFRIMHALLPGGLAREFMGKAMRKNNGII